MSRMTADRARRALLRALEPHAGPFTPIGASSRDWASALFEGARHRLALTLDGPDAMARAARLQAELAETELAMAGGFVADIAVSTRLDAPAPVLAIEALTIEEPAEPAETLSRAGRRAG